MYNKSVSRINLYFKSKNIKFMLIFIRKNFIKRNEVKWNGTERTR